jgi:hypothetical protein
VPKPNPIFSHPARPILGSVAALFSLLEGSVHSQDAVRNSMAGDAAAEQRRLLQENQPYTIKSGDFRLLITPSLDLDWNDNVNVSGQNQQQDVILRPLLKFQASYPVTRRNLLTLDIGLGYDYYFDHTAYSGPRLESGSQVAFDIFVKDFKFDLHDRFSFTQDSAGYASVYGTAKFGAFQNTAGLSVDWDLEDVVLTLGYDHLNYLMASSENNYIDHRSEIFDFRPGLRLHPKLTVGLEGTASFTRYDQRILNDVNNYSGGVYADWRPGSALSIQPRAGYTVYDFQQTSLLILAQNQTSWYVDLTARHAITESITYSLSAGHELQPGIQANIISDWYARPSISWGILKNVALTTSLSYEHGQQSGQGFGGAASETFDWFGGGVTLAYSFMKNLRASLSYRGTIRDSSSANRTYSQNLVGLQLTYLLQ